MELPHDAYSTLRYRDFRLLLAHRPAFTHAGRTLLSAVIIFGVCTIIFGLSSWFWLSFLMLFLLGAFDNISVVARLRTSRKGATNKVPTGSALLLFSF
jgi:hypothetical protein